MRWNEVVGKDCIQINESNEVSREELDNLSALLSLLQSRVNDQKASPKIRTQSLINMMQKLGMTFSYDSLVAANNQEEIKNLIKSFNKDEIIIKTDSDGVSSDNTDADVSADTVEKMAKSAISPALK